MVLTFHFRLRSYAQRTNTLSDVDESVAKDLSEVERYLLKTQELMTVRGKVHKNFQIPGPKLD